MQLKFKTAHGKRTPAEIPGASIIEQLDREIEEGEFPPFRMEELPSKEEVMAANKDKNDYLGIPVALTASGHYLKQQVRVKVRAPRHSEEFRMRIELLWAGIELAKIRNPHNPQLQTSSEKVWQDHVKYILGPQVKGLKCKNTDGSVAKLPSWELVLYHNQ